MNETVVLWLSLLSDKSYVVAIADGLEFIPKDDPETCLRNFDQQRRGWLPRFCALRGIIWMGTWRTLQPSRILHTPGAIS